jgi:hypothetical protein
VDDVSNHVKVQKEKEGKWLASNIAPGKITSREPQDGDLQ